MQVMTRSALALTLAAMMPVGALAQEAQVSDVARMIDQLAAQVAAGEAQLPAPGTEGAAAGTLATLRAELQTQEDALSSRIVDVEAAKQTVLSALPPFPAAPAPTVIAPMDPVVAEPVPVAPVAPDGGQEQLAEVETVRPIAPPQDAWDTVGLTPLSDLTTPLAFNSRARRVLSRPGARMMDGAGTVTELPAFSVMYVYGEGQSGTVPVLAVGRGTRGAEGWVQTSRTEDWRTMLVMSYAPRSGRDRTIFFRSVDDVFDILDLEEGSAGAIDAIHQQIEQGTYDPERIVAIEPALTVDTVERPYLMPVLDFVQTNTETHGNVTILQLAALNRDSTDVATVGQQPVGEDRTTTEFDGRDFKVGVAFVIDTTRSMGPYIDGAQDFVRDISFGLAERGLQDRFDFALVGYRDNVGAAPDVEYLRRVYRDFGEADTMRGLFADVEDMRPSAAPTANWREDAFAGIDLAIGELNWGEVDSRLVFLITDASPRTVGDALASNSRMGPETINALAAQRNISLFVVHMQTDEAARVRQSSEGYDDTQRALQLYGRMSRTGDPAVPKYFSVGGETETAFADSLDLVAGKVMDILTDIALGTPSEGILDPLDDDFVNALSGSNTVVVDDADDAALIANAVAAELFRYHTEYLGARAGVEAPDFYRGWAVDRDIANPNRRALEVSVFVTREQLSDLANRLEDIVTRLEEKDLGMGDFFSSVQAEAGSTAVDPSFGSFLPGYLDDLPYGSTFINMTPSIWDDLGETSRTQLLDEVTAKLASYKQIYSTQDGWIMLDERAPEDQVYPLPLRDLP